MLHVDVQDKRSIQGRASKNRSASELAIVDVVAGQTQARAEKVSARFKKVQP
jgi:hypothetical protein